MRAWEHPIPRVLHRPNLFLGGERDWVLTVLLAAVWIGFTGLSIKAFIAGGGFWMICHPVLLWMASIDTDFTKVYRRSLKFRVRYAYRPRPYRRY